MERTPLSVVTQIECVRRGITVAQLARRAGICYSAFRERLSRKVPSAETIGLVADVLPCEVKELHAGMLREAALAERRGDAIGEAAVRGPTPLSEPWDE